MQVIKVTMEEVVAHAANFDESMALILRELIAAKNEFNKQGGDYMDKMAKFTGSTEACLMMLEACLNSSTKAVIEQKRREAPCVNLQPIMH